MIPAKKCAVNASRLSHSSTWVYACICINIEYILQLNCWDVSTFCILQGILDTLRAMRVWQFLVQASNCKSQTRSCRMVQTTQSVFPMSRRSLNWTTPLPASASCITLPTYLTLDSANLWNICSQAMVNTNSVEVCLYHQRFHLPAQAASGLIGRVVRNPILWNLPFPYAVLNCWSWNPRPTQDFAKGPGAVENHRILIPRQMSVCVSSPHVERVEFAYCFAPNFRMFLLCSPILESCVKGECTG